MTGEGSRDGGDRVSAADMQVVAVGDRIRIQRPAPLSGRSAEVVGIVEGFGDGGAVIEVRLDDGEQCVLVLPLDAFELVARKGESE